MNKEQKVTTIIAVKADNAESLNNKNVKIQLPKNINPRTQSKTNKENKIQAIPFPPLKFNQTGNICPITATKVVIDKINSQFPYKYFATIRGTIAFNPSNRRTNAPHFFPNVLATFVDPIL